MNSGSLSTIRILGYTDLQDMGYSVDVVVEQTVALSSGDISGYQSLIDEGKYWANHRRSNMPLFICAVEDRKLVGHFSAMRVSIQETQAFLKGESKETDFTVFPSSQSEHMPYYVYVSAIVVEASKRNSAVTLKLLREGYRMLQKHLKEHKNALGIFAESYSKEGQRLCEIFGMKLVSDNLYVKER